MQLSDEKLAEKIDPEWFVNNADRVGKIYNQLHHLVWCSKNYLLGFVFSKEPPGNDWARPSYIRIMYAQWAYETNPENYKKFASGDHKNRYRLLDRYKKRRWY